MKNLKELTGKRGMVLVLGILTLFMAVEAGAVVGDKQGTPNMERGIRQPGGPASDHIYKEGAGQKAPEYALGEVLVKFKEGADPQKVLKEVNIKAKAIKRAHSIKPVISNFRKDYKLKKVPDEKLFREAYKKLSPNMQGLYRNYKITLHKDTSAEEAVSKLKDNPKIEYAYLNYIREASSMPSDPKYPEQWALPKISAPQGWDITEGDPSIAIAVIDTGVDYNHEDLSANIWHPKSLTTGKEEIPNNGIDDDENGYVDDYNGYDFVSVSSKDVYPGEDPYPADNNPMDVKGHGTHVSGIIAAVKGNNIGISGVAPKCKVMAVRAGYKGTDGNGYLTDSDIEQAILYAIQNRAKVISMSFGGYSLGAYEDELKTAYGENIVLVAAAGNNNTSREHYPSAMEEAIAVAATDTNDNRAWFSNYGDWVDVAAPGISILSTLPDNQYASWSGTSMACPHVSGLAALVVAKNPSLTNNEVKNILQASSDYIDTDPWVWSRINIYNSVNIERVPSVPLAQLDTKGNIMFGAVAIRGTAAGETFKSYSLYYGEEEPFSGWTLIYSSTRAVEDGILYNNFDTSLLKVDVQYILRLAVMSTSGAVIESRSEIIIKDANIFSPLNRDIVTTGNIVNIEGWISNNIIRYSFELGEGAEPSSWSADATNVTGNRDGVLATWDTSGIVKNGIYSLRLVTEKTSGTEYLWRIIIYVDTPLDDLPIHPGWPKDISIEAMLSPVVADLDNDGKIEIIISAVDGRIHVLDSEGNVRQGWETIDTGIFYADSPAVGDITGDDVKEVIVSNPGAGGSLYAFDAHGQTVSGFPILISLLSTGNGFLSPVIADLDEDEKDEILITTPGYRQPATLYAIDGDGKILWTRCPKDYFDDKLTKAEIYAPPCVADVDGDGKDEIFLSATTSYPSPRCILIAFKNNGNFVWKHEHGFDLIDTTVSPIVVNLNLDGSYEVLWTARTESGTAEVRAFNALNGADYTVGSWPITLDEPYLPKRLAAADVNRDFIPEVVVNNSSLLSGFKTDINHIAIYTAQGALLQEISLKDFSLYYNEPALVDIAGDDDLELIVATVLPIYPERCYYYAFYLDGSIVDGFPVRAQTSGNPYFYNVPCIDDLDGDGLVEMFGVDGKAAIWDFSKLKTNASVWPMYQHDPQHTGRFVPSVLPTPNDTTPPATPGAPSISSGSNPNNTGTYTISWAASTDADSGLKEYHVFRNAAQVATVTVVSYSETNLGEGAYSYYIKAADKAGNISSPSPSLDVIVDKTPPVVVITSPKDGITTDKANLTVYYTVEDNGEKLEKSKDVILKPGANQIIIEEVDAAGNKASASITVNYNRPPELAPIGNKSVNENAKLEFTLSAADADADTLTYSASNLPTGATFNALTKTFTWTPSYTQAGTYSGVSFSVSDGTTSDSESISITVANVSIADLVTSPIIYTPTNPRMHQIVTFKFSIANSGDKASGSFKAALKINGRRTGLINISNLSAGATVTKQWQYRFTKKGTYTVSLEADSQKVVPELNEDNNIQQVQVTVN